MNATGDIQEIAQLLGNAVAEMSNLVQTQMALVRAEISQKAQLAKVGILLILAGVIMFIPAMVLLLMAVAAGLAFLGLSDGWSDLVAAILGAGAGGGLIALGASRLSGGAMTPTVTLSEMQRDKTFAKELIR